jgi:hypothetical protein
MDFLPNAFPCWQEFERRVAQRCLEAPVLSSEPKRMLTSAMWGPSSNTLTGAPMEMEGCFYREWVGKCQELSVERKAVLRRFRRVSGAAGHSRRKCCPLAVDVACRLLNIQDKIWRREWESLKFCFCRFVSVRPSPP